MKTIRLIAAMLLTLNGILHIVEYLQMTKAPGTIGIILFGGLYIIVGFLLFNKEKYPLYLGIIVPLVGMTLSFVKFGVPELLSLSALFKFLGVIVVICCIYVLSSQKKVKII